MNKRNLSPIKTRGGSGLLSPEQRLRSYLANASQSDRTSLLTSNGRGLAKLFGLTVSKTRAIMDEMR